MNSIDLDKMPTWPGRMGVKLAAQYLGVSRSTLYDRLKTGKLPAPVHEGGRVFWARCQLDEFIAAQFGLGS